MPQHAFRFYSEAGNLQPWYNLSDRSTIDMMQIDTESNWDDAYGDYDAHQRYDYAPGYRLRLSLRIEDKTDFAYIATMTETIRRGYKFSFAYDTGNIGTIDLASQATPGDDEINVTGTLRIGGFYRMIGDSGYWDPTNDTSMEYAWPGYQNIHLFRVTGGLAGIYTISPPIQQNYRAGSRIAQRRYFESCLLLSDALQISYADGKWYWLWNAEFTLQRPPELTSPAW